MPLSHESTTSIYLRLIRNPPAMIFLIIFMILYMIILAAFTSYKQIDFVDLAKSLPLAVSALILGLFSILFWALNYIGREKKIELEIKKAESLFNIRREAIDRIFEGIEYEDMKDLSVLKAHLLLHGGEIKSDPETPMTQSGFDYGDALKAVLRKN